MRDAAHHKLKATREREERRCVICLHVFLRKKYAAKAKPMTRMQNVHQN